MSFDFNKNIKISLGDINDGGETAFSLHAEVVETYNSQIGEFEYVFAIEFPNTNLKEKFHRGLEENDKYSDNGKIKLRLIVQDYYANVDPLETLVTVSVFDFKLEDLVESGNEVVINKARKVRDKYYENFLSDKDYSNNRPIPPADQIENSKRIKQLYNIP